MEIENEALDLIQQLLQAGLVGQDKVMELLQSNSEVDGSINNDGKEVLDTVPEEEDKDRETTIKH